MAAPKTKRRSKKTPVSTRPPVVVVLGHIDHGKTSILDAIRKTKIVEKESGGITQHIGAYQATHEGKTVTFIDTPGHEAFSAMRARGASIADIAVLVVASDDGVKPQTKEAIAIAKDAGTPLVIALNKIDKTGADPERVKGQLAESGVLVEGRGGDVPAVLVSAKRAEGIDELLEVIALVAELHCDLAVDTAVPASGIVLEAHQDSRRGLQASFLVQRGILRVGDVFAAGAAIGKVRLMEDFRGAAITEGLPSTPVQILGFKSLPVVGDSFLVASSETEAEELVSTRAAPDTFTFPEFLSGEQEAILSFMLKADVQGSLEALAKMFGALPSQAVGLRPVGVAVGEITETDVKHAAATGASIFGFRVKVPRQVLELSERSNVTIQIADVIYELLEKVQERMKKLLRPEIRRHELGEAEILKIFRKTGLRQIVGGKVRTGKVVRGAKVEILRSESVRGEGKVLELQREKEAVDSVEEGLQCGLLVESAVLIETGDILRCFEEERIERSLV